MRAGLLADIILGDSPYLKGLVRYYNFLVLDQNGKITGFNNHFVRNTGKTEEQVINQSFAKFFDSDEGKVELQYSVRQALKGTPTVVSFHLPESRISFKGVILPVYDKGHEPSSIIVIAKEEVKTVVEEDELEDFWKVAQDLIAEAGIAPAPESEISDSRMKKPRILLVEDQNGLIVKVFKRLLQKSTDEVILAPGLELALQMADEFKPDVVITDYNPLGDMDLTSFTNEIKSNSQASVIYLTAVGNELRIEDGWLDIHVKNQADSFGKILDLIHQLYW